MTNDQIKEIALANGFKLKEQPNGEMELNPYVYDAFRAAIKRKLKEVMAELKSMESNDNTIEMSAMLDMCQDVIERHIDEPYTETWTDGYDDADEIGAEWRRQMGKD